MGLGVYEQAVGFCKSFAKSDQFYFSSLGFQIEYLTIFTFIVKGLVVKQVQFYLLNQPNSELNLACELAANAWRLGKRVLIACETEQQAFEVDELLWARDPNALSPIIFLAKSHNIPRQLKSLGLINVMRNAAMC